MLQKTIKNKIKISGHSLHSNQNCDIVLTPAVDNYGIRINGIEISPFNVTNTNGMTIIKNYSMIEHLMSALFSLGIDNIDIKTSGSNELPILDGCSKTYINKILRAGIKELESQKNIIKINSEILVKINDSYIKFIPTNQNIIQFNCQVDFPYVGYQEYSWDSNDFNSYYNNISNALTFFWDEQLEIVQSNSGAKGITATNTIILTKKNCDQYKKSEFARHKILDLIGDIATLNIFTPGKIIAYKPGHKINNLFARKLHQRIIESFQFNIPFMILPQNRNRELLKENINQVFDNQNYIDNQVIVNFEEKLAKYLNVNNVIAVNSGTSALMVSLLSLELGDEDIVIVPRLTFWATYQAVKILGKQVALVDVDNNYQLDINLVKQLLTKVKVKAIITVHLYGIISNNYQELKDLSFKNNIILIEDSSQAFGSKFNNINILSNSYISCVSMYPTKLYGSCGNSGFIVTSNDVLAGKMRSYRDNGRIDTRYNHYFIGGNFVMDSINAVYNMHKLDYINEIINNTSLKFNIYYNNLKSLKLFEIPLICNQEPNGFNFILKSIVPKKRDKTINYLKEKGINTSIIYPKLIDQQEGYIKNKFDNLIQANNKLCDNIFSIPIYYDLTSYQQSYIINNIINNDVINSIVIGCGNMGSKHLKNLIDNTNFKVLGYIDKFHLNNNLKKIDKIDSTNNIDFAIISTNNKSHYEIAVDCINKKINILIEKPAFTNNFSYQLANNLAINNGVNVGVSMLERYNPFLKYIDLELVSKINITRVCWYTNNFNPNQILHDLFIHDLDILIFYHKLDLKMVKIVNLIRIKDLYQITLKYKKTDINITVGNSKIESSRKHLYYLEGEKVIEFDFVNNHNKIKEMHNDYINYLINKPNKICSLMESFNRFEFINKIYTKENKLEHRL